jgi:hypothetical protein
MERADLYLRAIPCLYVPPPVYILVLWAHGIVQDAMAQDAMDPCKAGTDLGVRLGGGGAGASAGGGAWGAVASRVLLTADEEVAVQGLAQVVLWRRQC